MAIESTNFSTATISTDATATIKNSDRNEIRILFIKLDNGKDNRVAKSRNTAFSLLTRPQRLTDSGSSVCHIASDSLVFVQADFLNSNLGNAFLSCLISLSGNALRIAE